MNQPFKFGMYGHSMYAKFGDMNELRIGSCRHCPENTHKLSIDQTEPKDNLRITKIMYTVKLYTTKDGKEELAYFKMQFLSQRGTILSKFSNRKRENIEWNINQYGLKQTDRWQGIVHVDFDHIIVGLDIFQDLKGNVHKFAFILGRHDS